MIAVFGGYRLYVKNAKNEQAVKDFSSEHGSMIFGNNLHASLAASKFSHIASSKGASSFIANSILASSVASGYASQSDYETESSQMSTSVTFRTGKPLTQDSHLFESSDIFSRVTVTESAFEPFFDDDGDEEEYQHDDDFWDIDSSDRSDFLY